MITPAVAVFGTFAIIGIIGCIIISTKRGRDWLKKFDQSYTHQYKKGKDSWYRLICGIKYLLIGKLRHSEIKQIHM